MLLRTEGLTRHFGGMAALDGVDVEVREGEILAVIGPNGAGKTTFFNVISGLLRPTQGRVMFRGQDITHLPAHEVARRGIARTFQTPTLFMESRVIDNVMVGHRLHTRSGFWDAILRTPRHRREENESLERGMAALETVGLDHAADLPVRSLSQEARKRLAIALALATGPRLLLLDEPTAGLHADETGTIARLIEKIRASGITVCLIEHKMRMVMGLADRIVVLSYGRKIAEGTPREIASDPAVVEAYLGGEHVA
ncbi:ABC transporter ATP-binding protein [Caldinitratiruptor microaerophilus]|uniref:ABC transporter ATP-binding protein n=1 Tax=Caldinitratiruptor microaerophilus TaxID=671077 RepID=A0AA35G768_9FIRM|nr:ABC transporter ATP-binding protein [Caldinitratiruptor microaerophilus]BDG58983.1 ABC transporter ATP-binding protein [Caldinitratiruptor microaerophilus]